MGNFDFLLKQKCFDSFSSLAVKAEQLVRVDPNVAIFQCRKAVECATAWVYSVDKTLTIPIDDSLCGLLADYKFKALVGQNISDGLHVIRKAGNTAAHSNQSYTAGDAILILNFLFNYMDWIDQTYIASGTYRRFSKQLALSATSTSNKQSTVTPTPAPIAQVQPSISTVNQEAEELKKQIEELKKKNAELQEEANKQKEINKDKYKTPDSDISEAETRRTLIDIRLKEMGWKQNVDWIDEYHVDNMPTSQSGDGYVDYVLFDDDGKPLAIVEAKRAKEPAEVGRKQAQIYADLLEKKFGVKPVIFLTNGFEIKMFNDGYPERQIFTFFSKKDLQSLHYNRAHRQALKDIDVSGICERYYQKEAINAVCEHLTKCFRKSLLVMATGSGKTRTILGLVKTLAEKGWVKNILFLADRTSLVSQAYGSAKIFLDSFPLANLCDRKAEERNPNARIIFSTYQTMHNMIDEAKDKDGKRIFTPGHFDLVICDEAHRSIYNRYQDIFNYFDSLLVGLTATPKDDIDKNTYQVFGLNDGDPTYYYSLEQAVKDEFLVNYHTLKVKTEFLERGIKYSDLSDADKAAWDSYFSVLDEDEIPEEISSSALNKWLFNADTVKKILDELMEHGLKLENGDKIGKTIIFAKNHNHAEFIRKTFNEQYPYLGNGFCDVIDNKIKFCDSLIDDFKKPDGNPQIAVSVDMLDTGIDVPECLNLVFFKPVYSYAKFWQMIGRGTRLCKGLIDGNDKEYFLIIDACQNFNFFEQNARGIESSLQVSLEHRCFDTRLKLLKALQNHPELDSEEYQGTTIKDLIEKVKLVPKTTFSALGHAKALDDFVKEDNYKALSDETVENTSKEIGPLLILNLDDPVSVRRFDTMMYGIELAYVKTDKKRFKPAITRLRTIAADLLEIKVPQVHDYWPKLELLLKDDYIEALSLKDYEKIRIWMGPLTVFLPDTPGVGPIFIDSDDEITDVSYDERGISAQPANTSFEPYQNRVQRYAKEHINEGVIGKIHRNEKLSSGDIKELEDIVWSKLGSKNEYDETYDKKDVGVLIRQTVGLDANSAKAAFSTFMDSHNLTVQQTAFINLAIDYIVENGLIENRTILMGAPFDSMPISAVFDDASVLQGFLGTIDSVNNNAYISR